MLASMPRLDLRARQWTPVRRRQQYVAPTGPINGFSPANTQHVLGFAGLTVMGVRRCPTLPHRSQCSTIGAVRLSFRVRNVTGRFPDAITAVTLSSVTNRCLNLFHTHSVYSCRHPVVQPCGVVLGVVVWCVCWGSLFVSREPHSGRVAFLLFKLSAY